MTSAVQKFVAGTRSFSCILLKELKQRIWKGNTYHVIMYSMVCNYDIFFTARLLGSSVFVGAAVTIDSSVGLGRRISFCLYLSA